MLIISSLFHSHFELASLSAFQSFEADHFPSSLGLYHTPIIQPFGHWCMNLFIRFAYDFSRLYSTSFGFDFSSHPVNSSRFFFQVVLAPICVAFLIHFQLLFRVNATIFHVNLRLVFHHSTEFIFTVGFSETAFHLLSMTRFISYLFIRLSGRNGLKMSEYSKKTDIAAWIFGMKECCSDGMRIIGQLTANGTVGKWLQSWCFYRTLSCVMSMFVTEVAYHSAQIMDGCQSPKSGGLAFVLRPFVLNYSVSSSLNFSVYPFTLAFNTTSIQGSWFIIKFDLFCLPSGGL